MTTRIAAAGELCGNCGMPSQKNHPEGCIPITLLFSRLSKQVVCVEVGKDFADVLLGFLTLPLSCLVRVLAEATLIHRPDDELSTPPGSPVTPPPFRPIPRVEPSNLNLRFALTSIANVFDSVAKMDEDKMAVAKETLLQAKPTFSFGAGRLLNTRPAPKEGEEMMHPNSGLFSCGGACNFATAVAATRCPKHNKLMKTAIKMVEDALVDPIDSKAAAAAQSGGGYVKPDIKFMVTNQLEIFASSSMKALITLEMIRSERVGDLDTMEVFVVAEEVLQLLKASLLSLTVLNDVFGKYCSEAKRSMPMEKGQPFFPDCDGTSCCHCSRMGVPLLPSGSS